MSVRLHIIHVFKLFIAAKCVAFQWEVAHLVGLYFGIESMGASRLWVEAAAYTLQDST